MIPTIEMPHRLIQSLAIYLGLLGGIASCTAAEPASEIAAYRTTPVSAFDLFVLATHNEIDGITNLAFLDGASKIDNVIMLEHIKHNFPDKLKREWKAPPLLSFQQFFYEESKDAFRAEFALYPLPDHPVFQAGLDREGDEIRNAFVKEAFQLAHGYAVSGIQQGYCRAQRCTQLPAPDWNSPLKFMTEVADRTSVIVTWDLYAPSPSPSDAGNHPRTMTELLKAGVFARRYKASSHLRQAGDVESASIAVGYRDSRTKDELFEQLKREAIEQR